MTLRYNCACAITICKLTDQNKWCIRLEFIKIMYNDEQYIKWV